MRSWFSVRGVVAARGVRRLGMVGLACCGLAVSQAMAAGSSEQAAPSATPSEPASPTLQVAAQANPGEPVVPPKPPLLWREWPVFDPFTSRRETVYGFGLDQVRRVSEDLPRDAWTLLTGDTVTTVRPHLWLTLERHFLLRFARRSTYMLELSSYDVLGGFRALGVEIGGGVGVIPLGVDVSRGDWSVSVASPRALLRLGFKVYGLRVSVDAYEQYTWRVWGQEDVWVRGVSLQLSAEQPRITERAGHRLIFTR